MNSPADQPVASTDSVVQAIVNWLLNTGRFIREPESFVGRLGDEFVAAGFGVWRLRVSLHTNHPLLTGLLYTWYRDCGELQAFEAPHGIRSTPAYVGSPIERVQRTGQAVRARLDRLPAGAHPVLAELAAEGGTDYLALPVVFSDREVNTFIAVSDAPHGFATREVDTLSRLVPHISPILEVMAQRRNTRTLLDTYLGPRSGERVLHGQIQRGDGELIHAAVWFSDLRGFTALTEMLAPAEMLDLLNTYFELVSDAVTPHGGEILRFIGDAMLVVFVETNAEYGSACRAALDAALDAFRALQRLNEERTGMDKPLIGFGLGLHVGDVIYGNVGARDRLDFTVMGSAVNRAARIESLSRHLQCPLLFSSEFAAQVALPVRKLGEFELRGVRKPQVIYTASDPDAVCWPGGEHG